MADLTTDELVAIVLVIVVGVVVFFEWRFLRSRREAKIQAAIEQDDAFNSIANARAIAQSLRDQGRDVLAGEVLIHQAEGAYERRKYKETLELTEKARATLKSSKMSGDLIYCPTPKSPNEVKLGDECMPAVEAVKRLPQNYLESKFIIETTSDRLEGLDSEDAKEARALLDSAKKAFEQEDFDESLKLASKARRLLDSGKNAIPAPRAKAANVVEVPNGKKCSACSSDVASDDKFCRKCGAKVGA